MPTDNSTPLILFSGLAADASVFAPQKVAFEQLVVPPWPVPLANDSLDTYSQRIALSLQPVERPIIGGASFGGIIALHVARYLQPRAVLLIGSIRAPLELPSPIRQVRPLQSLLRFLPVRGMQTLLAPLLAAEFSRRKAPHLIGLAQQFRTCDPNVFKWSLARLMDWEITPQVDCPIRQIHGAKDFVMPMKRTKPDRIIADGGHVISLTHPAEVNDFIAAALAEFAAT